MNPGITVSELIISGRTQTQQIGPLSFTAAPGSAVGIVGESGAGKTMSLRAMMGLLPDGFEMRAEIRLDGQDDTSDDVALRGDKALQAELGRRFGVVLQNPFTAFDPLKPVGAQITEGVLRRGLLSAEEAGGRATDLLGQMGFARPDEIMRLFPHQLSGGMAQRIAVAMAVMPRPRLLLADEPTSALDASLRIGVMELLRRYTRTSDAVLVLVSHDLALVGRFCDQLIVMYGGQVVERGTTATVLTRPRHPYTQALLVSTPQVSAEGRRRLPEVKGSLTPGAGQSGCGFAPRCPHVMDRCREEEPVIGTGREGVACHLASEADHD